MNERNYLLPLLALAIGGIFLGLLTAGIVVWNRMPVMVGTPPVATTTPIVPTTTPPPPTPTAIATPTTTTIAPPTPVIIEPMPMKTTTTLPNADASIARLRPAFRACYNRGLARDPNLEGSITITINVAPNGDITSVTKTGSIEPTVDACMLARARGGSFDASPSGATISFPVRFVHAK